MAKLEIVALFTTLLALILNLLQLKYQGKQNMFKEHPMIGQVAVISLIMCWFLLGIKYLRSIPIGLYFFGSLLMASTASLLLPEAVQPLVFFVCLVLPTAKTLNWVFAKLEAHFAETEFWMTNVDPALCYLRRRVNRIIRPVMGQTIHIIPL